MNNFSFCVKIIMEVFDLKKGQIKRMWTKEQKLAIIKRYYEEHISAAHHRENDKSDTNEKIISTIFFHHIPIFQQ